MNKRIICLLLSMVMLLACLAGCGKKDDEEVKDDITEEASASAITLSMYLMSDAPVSAEQAAKIEAAVNKITKSKFKTQMKLTFLTEDQYYTVLEENLKKQSENAGNYGAGAGMTDESTEAETVWNDQLGIVELKYPTISGYQVDIFYFDGEDRFDSYLDNGYLSILDGEISGASKALKSYITPAYLTYMNTAENGTYAIPTNKPIGEYTYMLLNKEALELTKYSPKQFSSLADKDCKEMLGMLATEDEWKDKFVPIYSTTGELDITGVQFWGVDESGKLSDDFSVLGGDIDNSKVYGKEGSYPDISNVLSSTSFVEQLKTLKYYESEGYYNDEAVKNGKPFAVGYMKGGSDAVLEYAEDYEIVVVDTPTLKTSDLYKDMFGVSSYTSNVSRSMQILTYLNTNEDFRNLILYGIEGENYEVLQSDLEDDNGEIYPLIKRLNENYKMSINKTGNTFIARPLENEMANRIEYYTVQNRDAKPAQHIGFSLDYYDDRNVDMEKLQNIRTLSADIYSELMACSYDELDALITAKSEEINASADVRFHISGDNNNLNEEGTVVPDKLCSFYYVYFKWLEDMKMYTPPVEEYS